MEKVVILCLNLSHPSGDPVPFLLDDSDENIRMFDDEQEANSWIKLNKRRPFAYAAVCLEDLDFEIA